MPYITTYDRDDGLIVYSDPMGTLDLFKPTYNLKWKNLKVLPANFYTMGLFLKDNPSVEFMQDYEKYKNKLSIMKNLKVRADDNDMLSLVNDITLPEHLNFLYPYQKLDAYVCSKRNSFANLNCMRSGKTLTTAASLHLRHLDNQKKLSSNPKAHITQKVIISIIQATNRQWISALELACPEYLVIDISTVSNKTKRRELWEIWATCDRPAILLANKQKITTDVQVSNTKPDKNYLLTIHDLKKVDYGIVVDEIQFIRNHTTIQSKAHIYLSAKADYRLALTGTKISNHGNDLYGLFKFLHPKKYSNAMNFLQRYFIEDLVRMKSVVIRKYERFNFDLQPEISGLLYVDSIERTEDEVLKWLPEYQKPDPFMLEMSPKQKVLYDTYINDMEFEYSDSEDDFDSVSAFIALRTKLLQVMSNPYGLNDNVDFAGAKEIWLLDYLKEYPTIKPIIFARFSKSTLIPLAKTLKSAGYKIGLIDGSVKDKGQVASDWQSGKYDILLCNIVAGGTGLTLDYADTAIFWDRDDNLANNLQAEKRITATKTTDTRIKQIINLLCIGDGSVDLVQYAQQNKKLKWVQDMYPTKMMDYMIAHEQKYGGK